MYGQLALLLAHAIQYSVMYVTILNEEFKNIYIVSFIPFSQPFYTQDREK